MSEEERTKAMREEIDTLHFTIGWLRSSLQQIANRPCGETDRGRSAHKLMAEETLTNLDSGRILMEAKKNNAPTD